MKRARVRTNGNKTSYRTRCELKQFYVKLGLKNEGTRIAAPKYQEKRKGYEKKIVWTQNASDCVNEKKDPMASPYIYDKLTSFWLWSALRC